MGGLPPFKESIMNIYLVKKFGSQTGYKNIKAFEAKKDAEEFAIRLICDIPVSAIQSGDEFVEVEEVSYELHV
jgi:hypothetical protein